MKTKTRNRSNPYATTPALAKLFQQPIPRQTERLPVVHRYAKHGRDADRNAIWELFSPWISILAYRLKSRNPEFYRNDVDDMIQDGGIGLMNAIRYYDVTGPLFHCNVRGVIKRQIFRGQQRMNFGRKVGDEHRNAIAKARAEIVAEEGRLPNQDEMAAKLRSILTNPNFLIGDERGIGTLSANDATGHPGHDPRDTRERSPDAPMMTREAIKLALGDLKGRDRKIFKLSLQGVTEEAIGSKFGLTRARVSQIVNGLLWEARKRADLAAYFVREPDALPAGCNKANAPSIHKFPAAKRAACA